MHWVTRIFQMDEATWERHASPWSCWTRVPILPLLCLAIWARVWIGWWCLVPVALLVVWAWVNPRAFPPPLSTKSWASRAVMGERVWLARDKVPVPRHHALWAGLLTYVAAVSVPLLIWGLVALQIWPLLMGLVLTLGGKFWFLDRMVWLYDDMARTEPRYAAWLR